MASRSRVVDAAERRMRRVGQRWTAQRRALVDALEKAPHPATVPELCAQAGVAQSSAYRNLSVLESAGIAHRIEAGEHARYELAEDLSDHHHHHLICTSCGTVSDFEPGRTLERTASEALSRAARKQGWMVQGHRLDVVGLCPSCA